MLTRVRALLAARPVSLLSDHAEAIWVHGVRFANFIKDTVQSGWSAAELRPEDAEHVPVGIHCLRAVTHRDRPPAQYSFARGLVDRETVRIDPAAYISEIRPVRTN